MLRHLTAGCLAAFFVLNLVASPTSAKPPDLPDDQPIIVNGQPASTEPISQVRQLQPVEQPAEEAGCCCCPLAKINNFGMCWLARMCGFCDKVRETAVTQAAPVNPKRCGYLSSLSAEACLSQPISLHYDGAPLQAVVSDLGNVGILVLLDPVALRTRGLSSHMPITLHVEAMPLRTALEMIGRPLGLEATVCGEAICLGEPIFTGCGPGVSTNASAEECEPTGESVCPKCEKMHQQVMLKRKKKVAGVEEQVSGLMKACYLAFGEGRHAKAADLAREAYALDPQRVEGDPLIYKLHLLAEKGQTEECDDYPDVLIPEEKPEQHGSLSLRPELPAVDPAIVPALDAVLIGTEGKEEQLKSTEYEVSVEPKAVPCCACCKMARQVCWQAVQLFLCYPVAADSGHGHLVAMGWSPAGGIRVNSLMKVEGMKILVLYSSGIPLIWVQADSRQTGYSAGASPAP